MQQRLDARLHAGYRTDGDLQEQPDVDDEKADVFHSAPSSPAHLAKSQGQAHADEPRSEQSSTQLPQVCSRCQGRGGIAVKSDEGRRQMHALLQYAHGHSGHGQRVSLSSADGPWGLCEWTEIRYQVDAGPEAARSGITCHSMYVGSAPGELRMGTAIASHAACMFD